MHKVCYTCGLSWEERPESPPRHGCPACESPNVHEWQPCDGDGKKAPRPSEMAERDQRADPTDGLRPLHTARRALFTGEEFAAALMAECDWFSGVPDSMFRQVLPHLTPYYPAPRENHAVAAAFGATLAGKRPCVLMQNSGFGLIGDAIVGLHHLCEIGLFLVVADRGVFPEEEVQHKWWGKNTRLVCKAFGIDWDQFGMLRPVKQTIPGLVRAAYGRRKVVALLVGRGQIDETK